MLDHMMMDIHTLPMISKCVDSRLSSPLMLDKEVWHLDSGASGMAHRRD